MTEPMPPTVSTLADRLYQRLPSVFRVMDADQDYLLKLYIHAATNAAGDVDDLIERIRGSRPVGAPTPVPWGLTADELTRWTQARTATPSALGDPMTADASWLPWLAQVVGAQLDPAASVPEHRDTIRYATSGWRAGSRAAIADAARSALTGSRYVRIYPHKKPDAGLGLVAGTPWEVTIVTRATETPDPGAVLGAVLRKGVKPAGVVLYTRTYEVSWDTLESTLPTWDQRDAKTWDQTEETGL